MMMTLLDQVLPQFDVNEVHAAEIRATPEQVYRALQEYRLSDSPVTRFLFGLRRLPALFTAKGRSALRQARQQEPPFIQTLDKGGFVKVAETPNEEIVVGLIGKFWEPVPEQVTLANGEAFLHFDDPAYAKAAMNFHLESSRNGLTRLSTETRVRVPDPKSRRLFRFYWALIGFFSGWIRVEMLRGIKKVAER
jgi:hypothetical protein